MTPSCGGEGRRDGACLAPIPGDRTATTSFMENGHQPFPLGRCLRIYDGFVMDVQDPTALPSPSSLSISEMGPTPCPV